MFLGDHSDAFGVFAVAGLSDAVDGYLAKRFGFSTRFGRILDPIADKALMLAAFVMLAILGEVPLWLAVIVIGRDALIVARTLRRRRRPGADPRSAPDARQALHRFAGALCRHHLASLAFGFAARRIAPYDAYALAVIALASTLDYLGIWLKAMRVVWNERASPS